MSFITHYASRGVDYIGVGCSKVCLAFGGVRPYLDEGLATTLTSIQTKVNDVLTGDLSNGNLEKDKVVDLTNTIQATVKSGERYILIAAFVCYLLTQCMPYFTTTLTVASICSALIAYDMNQLHRSTLQFKAWLTNLGEGPISQADFLFQMKRVRAELQNNTLLFARSILYGRELEVLPDFSHRKIAAGANHREVKWLPETSVQLSTLTNYVDAIKGKVTTLAQSSQAIEAEKLQEVVAQILRPLAFARGAAVIAALGCYLASGYIPFVSSLFFVSTWVAAFFAWEFHQVHHCIREELGDWLIDNWGKQVSSDDLIKRIRTAALLIQETSFLLNSRFVFKAEIEHMTGYAENLIKNGNVAWVTNGTLETLVGLFKSLNMYLPATPAA